MHIQAKFKVSHVTNYGQSREVVMQPVYSSDRASPNYSWSQATPSGSLSMTISNPAVLDQFAPGDEFLLTFTKEA